MINLQAFPGSEVNKGIWFDDALEIRVSKQQRNAILFFTFLENTHQLTRAVSVVSEKDEEEEVAGIVEVK